MTYIRKAGIAHCELEAIYSECMDYESLNEYTDYICREILENFNDQLKNTSKIYTSIAESMTNKYKTNDSGTVLRIG